MKLDITESHINLYDKMLMKVSYSAMDSFYFPVLLLTETGITWNPSSVLTRDRCITYTYSLIDLHLLFKSNLLTSMIGIGSKSLWRHAE